jgi:hypothetical protein
VNCELIGFLTRRDFAAIDGVADQVVLEVSTGGGTGRLAFFDAARSVVQLDPPVERAKLGRAVGLIERESVQLPERRIVIMWPFWRTWRTNWPRRMDGRTAERRRGLHPVVPAGVTKAGVVIAQGGGVAQAWTVAMIS